ncbi:hypothetical protein ABIB75_007693 [Bradyrhizobium sp. GM2.2]|uniref:hypothetical protein n=1 Tax=Bradyrhizobium sp. GM2.2 TaxID=3156358 RepID=UPI003394A8A0
MTDVEKANDQKTNDESYADTQKRETVEEWLAIRKRAGLEIDPAIAEIMWTHGLTLDPYGVRSDLPEELRQIGRVYFARAPGSDIWVSFGDLPDVTCKALWKRPETRPKTFVDDMPAEIQEAWRKCVEARSKHPESSPKLKQ